MFKIRHSAFSHPFVNGPLQSLALRLCKVGGADEWSTDRSLTHGWQPNLSTGTASLERSLHQA